MSAILERIESLGLKLPEPQKAIGTFAPFVRSGHLLFVSGQIPQDEQGDCIAGRVGVDLTVEEGARAARIAGLSLVAAVRSALSSLDEVRRVVRIGGFVNAEPGFSQQPAVINGCSDLMVEIWGERGRHARAAVGVASLPANAAVEVDGIFEVA